jgi:hypothetical protein
MPTCFHCLAETPDEHYRRVVYNEAALYGPWRGWRLAGRYLVNPTGERLMPERLRGLMFIESIRPKKHSPAPVIWLPTR